jgi:hypothetical protein
MGEPVNKLLDVKTFGETFGDGTATEAVSRSPGQLALLLRNATRTTIARRIEYAGRIYRAPELNETLRSAIRFPLSAKNYGSTRKLFHRIQELFNRQGSLTDAESSLMTAWVASSWFPDFLSSPPTLFVSGADMANAVGLFRLLHCLCRRAVVLGGINRNSFLSLGPLSATLLINGPSLSPGIRDLWKTSNYRGVHVFGNGGLYSLANSKAVFTGMADGRYVDQAADPRHQRSVGPHGSVDQFVDPRPEPAHGISVSLSGCRSRGALPIPESFRQSSPQFSAAWTMGINTVVASSDRLVALSEQPI